MIACEASDGSAWWKKAQGRDSWKTVIKEAKAHKGLQCQIRGRDVRFNILIDYEECPIQEASKHYACSLLGLPFNLKMEAAHSFKMTGRLLD
jgi:hypothetical protein